MRSRVAREEWVMKKGLLPWILAAAIALMVVAAADSQEDMQWVDNRVFANPQRPPAVFDHDPHNEAAGLEDCSECHHVYEDGQRLEDESSEDQRCADCHGLEKSDGTPSLVNAFHGNCKGCHLQQAKGPILCGECHVKP
jgi:hypothetical protein